MTDEFYACGECGVFNESAKTFYKVNGRLTEDELDKLEELGIYLEYEEMQVCSICNQEANFLLVSSTER